MHTIHMKFYDINGNCAILIDCFNRNGTLHIIALNMEAIMQDCQFKNI